ncbi:MAG TPA: DinB family protein [Terriglobales bacterium]|nr:DinB family protein [Terriglobales bacterium]
MDPGISFADLLAYNTGENEQWKRWFAANPAALDLPCDVAGAGSVCNLVLHVFATELFFAHRLLDQPKVDYDNLPHSTLDELFAITTQARQKFDQFLANSTPDQWTTPLPLGFGNIKASKRKMLMQAVMHSIHHRAQLATFLRQQGFKQDWMHDFITSEAMD